MKQTYSLNSKNNNFKIPLLQGWFDISWSKLKCENNVFVSFLGLQHLEIIPFKVAAYDSKAKKMAFFEPDRKDDFIFISGTKMRSFARNNEQPPDGFMAPKAWQVLAEFYQSLKE